LKFNKIDKGKTHEKLLFIDFLYVKTFDLQIFASVKLC